MGQPIEVRAAEKAANRAYRAYRQNPNMGTLAEMARTNSRYYEVRYGWLHKQQGA